MKKPRHKEIKDIQADVKSGKTKRQMVRVT